MVGKIEEGERDASRRVSHWHPRYILQTNSVTRLTEESIIWEEILNILNSQS